MFILVCFSIKAQDTIILKDYSIAIGKVTKISEDNIEYKSIGNLDGPIYTLKYSTIAGIKYPNGHIDVFDSNSLRSYYNIKDKKKTTYNEKTVGDVYYTPKKTVNNNDSILLAKQKQEKLEEQKNQERLALENKKKIDEQRKQDSIMQGNKKQITFNYDDDNYNTQKKTENNSNTLQTDKQEQGKLENQKKIDEQKKQDLLMQENKKQLENQKMQQPTTNNCTYLVNKVDEFTKVREVRTNSKLLFKENNTAMYLTGLDNSHSSYKLEVLACNFNGVNKLLFYGICCNCSKNELFERITLLLQNSDVITFENKIANYKVENCSSTWQFYDVNDSTWAKLKSSPLKKIRINFSDNTASTVEIKEKNINNIIYAINCIDVLEIPKPQTQPQIIREINENQK
ncbi:MAG: hypothetical protein A2X08_11425 [Bacteroidetes bacterium GWA2_32_17]|nr:MAG: hypothetical protein A2X08_11425 [Bacteroidetes bacterium GWA2_32_17]